MDKVWNAKWIMDHRFYGLAPVNVFKKENEKQVIPEHSLELKNLHMLVRKDLNCEGSIKKAFIDITADDYYKLYINGRYVAQGPTPGYYFHYYYNRHDITSYLSEGVNTIAVHVYYQGLINRVWNSGDYRQGLIAEVFINDCLHTVTDNTWKYIVSEAYQDGGLVGYQTQYMENIDSQKEVRGWLEPGFNDEEWKNVCESISDDHKLVLQPTPPLQVYEVKPEKVKKTAEGLYLLDFGHEITGQFKMEASGEQGQVIEIRCAEELVEGKEDEIRYNMRCNCTYREFWTLSGDGRDVLNLYDYKGFRYVEVIGPENAIIPESFSAIVRHYPFNDNACLFNSSDALLNQIWQICKNGVKYGTQENYVDCPTREKGHYLGDNTIIAHSHIYLTGDLRLFKKALKDFALSSFICKGLMCIAPGSLSAEIADYSLQWPMQLLLYYMHSGDKEFLREMLPVAEKILEYFKSYQRQDGLLESVTGKWNLVDWPSNLRDGYDFDLCQPTVGDGCHNVINAFYIGCIKTMNEIRDILGIQYKDDFPKIKESFGRAFYSNESLLFTDAEHSGHSALHSNMLPLLYGLVPEEARDEVIRFMRIKRFSCGVYMGYFLLKALAAAGEYDLVYDLINATEEHSWGNMVKEGATTCFEAWGKDQKWNTSLCHAWASAPIPVLIEDIAGVTPLKPGWEEISFDPHIPASLEHMSIEFTVKTGTIKVEHRNGETIIKAPDGVKVCK